ncbi:MAG TPA: hypothetical protein VNL14_09190 [Candidatus Acidoferrales bacterium]|nr:hypothetical protein [Candidatus Acidoferrales bacterium]
MNKIDELRHAVAPALVERGRDDSVLMIAFTGFVHRLSLRIYEFFEATKALGYSRILLRDKYRVWYHHGIDRERRDIPRLVRYLEREISRLNPRTVICLGTSAGGYAALLAGHLLRADYVHAFAPDTFLDVALRTCLSKLWRSRYPWARCRLRFSRRARPEFFDLAEVLKNHNRKTTYFVHYCEGCERDVAEANRVANLPGVQMMPYPCDTHQVAIFLAKRGFLAKILNAAHQTELAFLARAHFRRDE